MTESALLTVGEAMLRLSPSDGGALAASRFLEFGVGGAELNAAIAASRMGLVSRWVSRLPDSVLADRIVAHARANGVEPVIAHGPERVGTYFIEIGAEPRGVTVTYDRDGSACCYASPADFDVVHLLEKSTAVFASGITLALGEGPRELVHALLTPGGNRRRYFEINHRSKLCTVQDMQGWIENILPQIDVLFASPHDLRDILSLGDDSVAAAQKALANFDLEYVVIANRHGRVGGQGVNSIQVVGRSVTVEAECEGRIVDPIGAGDAGAGVFIAALEQGIDPQLAAVYSSRASAWVQTHPGDSASFRRDEICSVDERRVRR